MPNRKEVVLIPYWIQEILRRNQLPLSTCLEFDKIMPILSTNDLCMFLALQDQTYFKMLTGSSELSSNLASILSNSIVKPNIESANHFWNTILPISNDTSFHNDLVARLFDVDSKIADYKDPFVIYDLTPEVCGVVIYPGYFNTSNNIVLQKAVIEAIIEVLYVYHAFHEVAKTPYFAQYLKLLSIK